MMINDLRCQLNLGRSPKENCFKRKHNRKQTG